MSDKEKLNASGVENGSTDDLKNKNAASPEANEEKASASESSVSCKSLCKDFPCGLKFVPDESESQKPISRTALSMKQTIIGSLTPAHPPRKTMLSVKTALNLNCRSRSPHPQKKKNPLRRALNRRALL